MTQQLNTALVPEWTLGDRLRKARELTGMDAVQFAEAILVHRDTVANYEKGKIHNPRRMVLRAWAQYTGVSLDWLQTGQVPGHGRPGGAVIASTRRGSNRDYVRSTLGVWSQDVVGYDLADVA